VLYATHRQTTYSATAVIRLRDTRSSLTGSLGSSPDNGLGGPTIANPLLSLVEVIASRSVAGTVVDSMPLLRLQTDGVPLGLLGQPTIAGNVLRDSLDLAFTDAGTTLAGSADTSVTPYGTPLGHAGFQVTVLAKPPQQTAHFTLVTRDDAISSLLLNLRVHPRENTDVVDVEYSMGDSVMAREVTNRLVELFQGINAEDSQQESHARRVFLEGQLHEVDSALADARQAVANFRARQRTFSARDRFTSQQAAVTAVQARRTSLDSQRKLYVALLQKAEASDAPNGEAVLALLSSPGLSDNPVIVQIADQLSRYQIQRDSLTSGPYGSAPTNPDVTRLSTLIAATLQRLAAAVRSNITILDEQISALDTQRGQSAPSYQRLSANESDEATLLEAAEAHRRRSDALREEYQNARLAEAVQVGQVQIVDLAGPAQPTGPSRLVIVVLGALLGGIAACLVAFALEYVRPTIWRQQDLAGMLDSDSPIVIPRFRGRRLLRSPRKQNARSLTMLGEPQGGSAEALRAVRTKLIFSPEYADLRTLLVTSTVEGEGKSTMAANLGIAFAQQGVRVLLVDSDMRRPNLHQLFGVKRSPGLASVLQGQASLEEAVVPTDVDGLSLLPAGPLPTNPAELLGGPTVRATLERLAAEFELVLLDSPPVLAVADASILSALTQGVLMVVRAGRAEREAIFAARDLLADVGAHVVGAVLNDPDGEVARSGGEYYFYGYGGERR
jgi:tyrosine-protein kinase Etk/Wzc